MLLKVLLESGAKVNIENLDGVTPLRQLLLTKPYNLEELDLLLSHGADIELRNKHGVTDNEYVEKIAHGDDAQILDVFSNHSNRK